jgi:DNA-binding MarR family transcriptional regulator
MNSIWLFYKLPKDVAGRRDLTAAAKVVLAILIDRIGQNDCCWPGIRLLAKDAGLSTPAVTRAIANLEAKGVVQIERQSNGRSNRYRLATCSRFVTTGVDESLTEALTKRAHNKIDPLNQIHTIRTQNHDRTGYFGKPGANCTGHTVQSRDRQGAVRRSGNAIRRNLADVPQSAYGIQIEA